MEMFRLEAPFKIDSILWLSSEKDRGIHTIRDKVNDFCKRTHAKPNTLRWIIVDDADTLPLISQQALRRPMETYAHLTKFIFAGRHATHLIEPLRSRCLVMEMEPISPMEVLPIYLKLYDIPGLSGLPGPRTGPGAEDEQKEIINFCLSNFVTINEMKSIIKIFKSLICEGNTTASAIEKLKILLPSSKIHINSLIDSISSKDILLARSSITQLFLNGYLLDDILMSIEKNISIFPSVDPAIRFRILQFTMLGWIFIQQGKEHWLDAIDILEQVMR